MKTLIALLVAVTALSPVKRTESGPASIMGLSIAVLGVLVLIAWLTIGTIQHSLETTNNREARIEASNIATSPSRLTELSNHSSTLVRELVAQHPFTPPPVLARLAEDNSGHIREFVAMNPNTPPETPVHLFSSGSCSAELLAGNRSTSSETLASLATSSSGSVVWSVAGNPNTPSQSLQLIADGHSSSPYTKHVGYHHRHPVYSIWRQLAGNPNSPPQVLEASMAAHKDSHRESQKIHTALIDNPSTPVELLVNIPELARTTEMILQLLRNHPDLEYSEMGQMGKAMDPTTRPEVLQELLSSHPRHSIGPQPIVGLIARNPNTPPTVLWEIADKQYGPKYYAHIAANPNAPADLLSDIFEKVFSVIIHSKDEYDLALLLVDHPNATATMVEVLNSFVIRHEQSYQYNQRIAYGNAQRRESQQWMFIDGYSRGVYSHGDGNICTPSLTYEGHKE